MTDEKNQEIALQSTEHSSPGESSAPEVDLTVPPDPLIKHMTPVALATRLPVRVAPEDLTPGTMIGEYQVLEKLGAGGMGAVYLGIHPIIGKRVAIKVLQGISASDHEVINRFILEARAVNKIGSKYIVDIFSFGVLPDGRNYFVMELLEGNSLREILKSRGRLSFAEARPIITCVARGLVAAHAKDIVHRDIKPENIMVLRDEDQLWRAKVLDFGIAKLQDANDHLPGFATRTGMAMGTPYYMSPEQCRGVGVDHRTDIYALGVVLFEVLTGRQPFRAESYLDLVNHHLYSSPPSPRSIFPNITPALDEFILQCLAKEPSARPQTMEEFTHKFDKVATLLDHAPLALAEIPAVLAQDEILAQDLMSQPWLPEALVTRLPPARRWVFTGAGVLLLVTAVILGWVFWGPQRMATRDMHTQEVESKRGVTEPSPRDATMMPQTIPTGADSGSHPVRIDQQVVPDGELPHLQKTTTRKHLKRKSSVKKKAPPHSLAKDRDTTLNPFLH